MKCLALVRGGRGHSPGTPALEPATLVLRIFAGFQLDLPPQAVSPALLRAQIGLSMPRGG